MRDIISRLNDIWRDDDHERGCQGRTYNCTCGFDNRTFKTAEDAVARIEQLERENADLLAALKPFARVADMEERAGPSDSVMVNVARCRDARDLFRRLAEQEGTE